MDRYFDRNKVYYENDVINDVLFLIFLYDFIIYLTINTSMHYKTNINKLIKLRTYNNY